MKNGLIILFFLLFMTACHSQEEVLKDHTILIDLTVKNKRALINEIKEIKDYYISVMDSSDKATLLNQRVSLITIDDSGSAVSHDPRNDLG